MRIGLVLALLLAPPPASSGPSGVDPSRFERLAQMWKDHRDRNLVVEEIGLTGEKRGLPVLLEALKDPGCDKRGVLEALGRLRQREAIPAIMEHLLSRPQDCYSGSRALGRIDLDWRSRNEVTHTYPRFLEAFLASKADWGDRFYSLLALFELFPVQAKEVAFGILENRIGESDGCSGFHSNAMEHLATSKDPRAVPLIVERLLAAESYSQGECVEALDQIDPEWRRARCALDAVRRLGPRLTSAMDEDTIGLVKAFQIKGAAPALVQVVPDERRKPKIRAAALDALVSIGVSPNPSLVSTLMKSCDAAAVLPCLDAVRRLPADAAVPLLMEAWKNPDSWVRLEVLGRLQQVDAPEVVDLGLSLLDQCSQYQTGGVLEILAHCSDPRVREALCRQLDRSLKMGEDKAWVMASVVSAMDELDSPSLCQQLVDTFKSLPTYVKPGAIKVMVKTGDQGLIPLLQTELASPDSRVRAYAEWGIYCLRKQAR
ncbi:MAG: hypothetical protein AB1714_17880 [Acidobacteriota bacterium]